MSLKLYRIDTMINHPDSMAGFYKDDKDIYDFFKLNKGDEEKILKRDLRFVAGKGYTLNNINNTDFIRCPTALLFSEKFVRVLGGQLEQDLQFIPCKLICESKSIEWYAARIKRRISVIDEDASIYRKLIDGQKIIKFARYRKDVNIPFFIAEDINYTSYYVVTELFKELCVSNNIHIKFEKPEIF